MEKFLVTFDEFRYLQKHKLKLEKRFNIIIILPEEFNSNTYASIHGVKPQIGALKDLLKKKTSSLTMNTLRDFVPVISLTDSESETPADPPESEKEVKKCKNPIKLSAAIGEENSNNVVQASSDSTSVEVPLELGYRAIEKARPTSGRSFYDWTLFVRGVNGCEIGQFVEKVIFRLPLFKKVIKEPPYLVTGTNSAGFFATIKVFFQWKEEPNVASFKYILHLGKGRPLSNVRLETLTFLNPKEEFLSMLRSADEPTRKRRRIEEATGLPDLSITSNVGGDRIVLLHNLPQESVVLLKANPTASTSQATDNSIYLMDNQGQNDGTLNSFNYTRDKTKEQKIEQNQHLPCWNSFLPPLLNITTNVGGDRSVLVHNTPQNFSQVMNNSVYVLDSEGQNGGTLNNFNYIRDKTKEQKSAQNQPLLSRNSFFPPLLFDNHSITTACTSQVADNSIVATENGSLANGCHNLTSTIEDNSLQSQPLTSVGNLIQVSSDDESSVSSTSEVADDSVIVIEDTEEENVPSLNNLNTNEVENSNGSMQCQPLVGEDNRVPPSSDDEIPESSTSQVADDSIVMIGHVSPKPTFRSLLRKESKMRKKLAQIQRLPPTMDFIPLPQSETLNRLENRKRKFNAMTGMGAAVGVLGDGAPPSGDKDAVVEVPRPQFPRLLRPVVIDGNNVAREHGLVDRTYSCRGIQISVDYFLERGHTQVTVFIPKHRKHQTYGLVPTTSPEILDDLARAGRLAYTPSRRVAGRRQVCYDDRFVVELAADTGGVILSNDNYRDIMDESTAFKKTIEERLLMFCFVGDKIMIPQDPAGRGGPSLDVFLSFP